MTRGDPLKDFYTLSCNLDLQLLILSRIVDVLFRISEGHHSRHILFLCNQIFKEKFIIHSVDRLLKINGEGRGAQSY